MSEQRRPRVLDIGNCNYDHGQISHMLKRNFEAEAVRASTAAEAIEQLGRAAFDLILVNRQLDYDGSEGIEVIKLIKSQAAYATVPIMMLTNYPNYQQQAVEAGALPGFGKKELGSDQTRERLANVFEKSITPHA